MEDSTRFADVVDAADNLSLDEQVTLIDVLRRRVSEQRREELKQEVEQSRQEFSQGICSPVSSAELMKEIEP